MPPDATPRYKPVDRSPRLLPVVLSVQIPSGTFEFAPDHVIERELILNAMDASFINDEVGASAYAPGVMLKVVLLAHNRGLTMPLMKQSTRNGACTAWRTMGMPSTPGVQAENRPRSTVQALLA